MAVVSYDRKASRLSYRKVVYSLTTEWTEVKAPIDANYFGLRNRSDVNILMKTSDDAVADVLAPGGQEGVTVANRQNENRFLAGYTLLWIRAESGTATATVTWVR